jgi:hypothetical protein
MRFVVPALGAIAVAETLTLGELLLERGRKPVVIPRPVEQAIDPMQTGSIDATDAIGRLITKAESMQSSPSGESKHGDVETIDELLKRMIDR